MHCNKTQSLMVVCGLPYAADLQMRLSPGYREQSAVVAVAIMLRTCVTLDNSGVVACLNFVRC